MVSLSLIDQVFGHTPHELMSLQNQVNVYRERRLTFLLRFPRQPNHLPPSPPVLIAHAAFCCHTRRGFTVPISRAIWSP